MDDESIRPTAPGFRKRLGVVVLIVAVFIGIWYALSESDATITLVVNGVFQQGFFVVSDFIMSVAAVLLVVGIWKLLRAAYDYLRYGKSGPPEL